MDEIDELKQRLEKIEKRNAAVELDKAWETSWLRRVLIAVFTYLAIGLYMWAIQLSRPFLNAIVPTIGFLLSTLALPWFKDIWTKRNRNEKS